MTVCNPSGTDNLRRFLRGNDDGLFAAIDDWSAYMPTTVIMYIHCFTEAASRIPQHLILPSISHPSHSDRPISTCAATSCVGAESIEAVASPRSVNGALCVMRVGVLSPGMQRATPNNTDFNIAASASLSFSWRPLLDSRGR